MPVRAVLFDVGGPLDREADAERRVDAAILAAVRAVGVDADAVAVRAASDAAVRAYAPDTYKAMVWGLVGEDPARARAAWAHVVAAVRERPFEVRPGIGGLLADVRARGLRLGLAANQPASAHGALEAMGLLPLFDAAGVAGTTGLRKPDVRVFLHACAALGVAPAETVMVGDRVDNDVAPARTLGMRTVRLVTGRHAAQRPRSWEEVPDAEVVDVDGMRAALLGWVDAGG